MSATKQAREAIERVRHMRGRYSEWQITLHLCAALDRVCDAVDSAFQESATRQAHPENTVLVLQVKGETPGSD